NNCIKNYNSPLWEDNEHFELLQLILIPLGVARIQRTVIEALAHGIISVKQEKIKIAVLERDIPCAKLAFDDLIYLINEMNKLSYEKLEMPEIELTVFATEEFIRSKFSDESVKSIKEFDDKICYDLIIDFSMFSRFFPIVNSNVNAKETISIRTPHFIETKRIIKTSDLIKYKPFCEIEEGSYKISDPEAESGLKYILQSIFRKKDFRPGQLPILNHSLRCKTVIGLLPTGGGKSLTYQLSAILQPGVCLIIDPIKSLMFDQVTSLNRNLIDSCLFVNSSLSTDERVKEIKKLQEGEVNFAFISPERLQIEEFRNALTLMNSNRIYFNYCVIDEVHCVSEWGHDFRTAYLRLGENAIKFCKTKNLDSIPLFGLTATASYDVLADVQRELSGNDESKRITEESIIRAEYSKRLELVYKIKKVNNSRNNLNDYWEIRRDIAYQKKLEIKKIFDEIPHELEYLIQNYEELLADKGSESEIEKVKKNVRNLDFNRNNFFASNNAALIFCPHTKGLFGVTSKFKDTQKEEAIYELVQSFDNIKPGYFIGSNSDDELLQRIIQEESLNNQIKFIDNELNLMVATKAFGMGIDKPNIRFSIHLNYPGSIESFVQESGRTGRDGKVALSYILFNDASYKVKNFEGEFENDFEVNMFFHKNSFKGVEKEFQVLDELLTKIYFPGKTIEIQNLIQSEINDEITTNLWEKNGKSRIYFKTAVDNDLGYFDLINREFFNEKSADLEISEKIKNIISNYLSNQNISSNLNNWIKNEVSLDGIEVILNNVNNDDTFNLTISFTNNQKDRIKKISGWLREVIHSNFEDKTVAELKLFCRNSDEFIESICDKYKKFTRKTLNFEEVCNQRDSLKRNPTGTANNEFRNYFNGIRSKEDTERALYRLSTLGIIDDYTVNFSSGIFTLFGKKKAELEYIKNLQLYLSKYYSEKSTAQKIKKLDEIQEKSTIRKCLKFLVSFVYEEIQKKRELAIHDMRTACRFGLERGSLELREYIDLYFNSKYARNGYHYTNDLNEIVNASLPDLTDNGKNDDLNFVFNFIEIVEKDPKSGQIDNLKHLRGACIRMLNNQPDSYTLMLLNAFALYMLCLLYTSDAADDG
ncbi:MAG: DEAD/DEAH box helicase, partial [Ignavibacteriaceae bacterium]|nr:DEAD/DEAH box helicase [Ignavibacteriaceae bacterium]